MWRSTRPVSSRIGAESRVPRRLTIANASYSGGSNGAVGARPGTPGERASTRGT